MSDHRLHDNILSTMKATRHSVIAWAMKNGYVEDAEAFATEITREVYVFVGNIVTYDELKARSKSHKRRNYHTELTTAVNSLNNILGTVFEHYPNPIFNGEEVEAQKHRANLSGVVAFLVNKQLTLTQEHLAASEKKLELAIEDRRNVISLCEQHKLLELLSADDPNRETGLERLNTLISENLKCRKDIPEDVKPEDRYMESTPKRSELRQTFVNEIALIFLDLAGRKDLNRTGEEVVNRKKNMFSDLVNVCFDGVDERITPNSMKKIMTQANSAIN